MIPLYPEISQIANDLFLEVNAFEPAKRLNVYRKRARIVNVMQRLTAYFYGNDKESGYRDRIVCIAQIFGMTGFAKNLEDGRVKVVAEGEATELQRFFLALDITKVRDAVDIQKEYSPATGEFEFFLNTDKPDRFYENMIEVSRGIKEPQAILKEMKAQRLRSHE